MAKKHMINKANFAYFFSVSFLTLFSLYLTLLLPFASKTGVLPQQLTSEEMEEHCFVPTVPVKPKAVTGPDAGQVTLSWQRSDRADYYYVSYGKSSLNYLWGSPDVGNVDSYIVSGLTPGKPYYFIVAAANGCGSSGALQEIAAYAGEKEKPVYRGEPDVVVYVPPEPEESISPESEESTPSATPLASLVPTEPNPSPTAPISDEVTGSLIDTITAKLRWEFVFLGALLILAIAGRRLVKKEMGSSSPPTATPPPPSIS